MTWGGEDPRPDIGETFYRLSNAGHFLSGFWSRFHIVRDPEAAKEKWQKRWALHKPAMLKQKADYRRNRYATDLAFREACRAQSRDNAAARRARIRNVTLETDEQ